MKFEQAMEWMNGVRMDDFKQHDFQKQLEGHLTHCASWCEAEQDQFVKAVLSRFEGCFGWVYIYAESQSNIFDLIKAGEPTLKSLNWIVKTFPNAKETQRLHFILSEVERIKRYRQHPLYVLEKSKAHVNSLSTAWLSSLETAEKSPTEIKDFGLKLALINQLMFIENKLKPRVLFDLFFEQVGFDEQFGASSDLWQYWQNLTIPPYLLSQITRLHLDSRAELYVRSCSPRTRYIGGGFLGRYEPIQRDAIVDLALLPNLDTLYIDDKCELKIEACEYVGFFGFGSEKYASHPSMRYHEVVLDTKFVEAARARGIKIKHKGQEING